MTLTPTNPTGRMPFSIQRVAIIGAGPAGLAAAKYLLARPSFTHIVIFEEQAEVGGVWNYSAVPPPSPPVPQTTPFLPPDPPTRPGNPNEPPLVPNPMYDRLHTNLPKGLMAYGDKPFSGRDLLLPRRNTVQKYLVGYGRDVRRLVRFGSRVSSVRLRPGGGRDRWDVVANSLADESVEFRETFDAVVVANGHNAVPFIPDIPGLREFHRAHPGAVIHSKCYRNTTPYAGQKTIVVGNGPSGLDIGRQISEKTRQPPLLSVRRPALPELLEHCGCIEVPEVVEFLPGERGVRLADGRVETDIDSVIFCTGYFYGYPFLPDLAHQLVRSGRGVHGLYYHVFYVEHPTLVFPGLPSNVVPWPICEAQAALFAAVWENALALPSEAEMRLWSQRLEEEKGDRLHRFASMGDGKYVNELHEWVGRARGFGGKEPPTWDGEKFWERGLYIQARIRFENQGCQATSLEDLGFHYEPHKQGGE